jgi:aryl-alcohol dehydrogenase-like predicted oxidoreductase
MPATVSTLEIPRTGRSSPPALALDCPIWTDDVYSVGLSEEITGHWLREMANRDNIVIATKAEGPMGPGPNRCGLSRKHLLEACENSLRRLSMDYVDLYQIHRWTGTHPSRKRWMRSTHS